MVKVKDSSLASPIVFNESPLESFTETEIVFSIPSQFRKDLMKFWEGKYSEYREEAKEQIKAYSSLAYRSETKVGRKKTYHTDARILILERDNEIRQYLEEELRVWIDPKSELISPPKEDEVWEYEQQLIAT